ncbi:MAG TPA: ATP-binding protein [Solirubrobacteraceae bacterium]|nr:ATP-binding protein [Solirubrobacteraceae bacterium]
MTTTRAPLEGYRALRAELERAVLPLAGSIDGRTFTLQASLDGLELELGGYVVIEGDGTPALGQVRSLEAATTEAGTVGLAGPGGDEGALSARLMLRMAVGTGLVLDGAPGPFHDRLVRPAKPEEVRAWAERAAGSTERLPVGTLALAPGVPAELDAGGFDRHTFLCGQSGSGKSYSLGVVLEQLLLRTGLRIIVLDPNSDLARFREVRDDADPAEAERWRSLAGAIAIRSAAGEDADRLRLRLDELEPAHQGAVLRLDPIAEREEYAELRALIATERPESVAELERAERPGAQALALRIANLGTSSLGVWARGRGRTAMDALADESIRCLVLDIGSLETPEEQTLVAGAVLERLWRLRKRRSPVLLVIDEAHNVCPAEPADPLTALATARAVQIAGEGRKFGIHLLVATQRPAKVHENVLSQCDNLILMRMNSPADTAIVRETHGFAPPGLVDRATSFALGEALVAGKIASQPAFIRFGHRVTREGGGDVGAAAPGDAPVA